MGKMKMPTVDVVRFTESDVIVASGGIMNVSNLGNGEEATDAGDGVWKFGTLTYTSSDIHGNPGYFVSQFNSYFGTKIASTADIRFAGRTGTDLYTLVEDDMEDIGQSSGDSGYNGSWRWNGSSFDRQ